MSTAIFGEFDASYLGDNMELGIGYFCQGEDCASLPQQPELAGMSCRPHTTVNAFGCKVGGVKEMELMNIANPDAREHGGLFKITLTADGTLQIEDKNVVGGKTFGVNGEARIGRRASGAGRTNGTPGLYLQIISMLLIAFMLLPGAYASIPAASPQGIGIRRRQDAFSFDFNAFGPNQLPAYLLELAKATSNSTAAAISELALTQCSTQYLSASRPWYREAMYASVTNVCIQVGELTSLSTGEIVGLYSSCNTATIDFIKDFADEMVGIQSRITRPLILSAAYLSTLSCKVTIATLSEFPDGLKEFKKVCGSAYSDTTWSWEGENPQATPCKVPRPSLGSNTGTVDLLMMDGRVNITSLDQLADPCPKCAMADWTARVFQSGDIRAQSLAMPMCSYTGTDEGEAVCELLCKKPCAVYKEADYGHLRGWKETTEYDDLCGGSKCTQRSRNMLRPCVETCAD